MTENIHAHLQQLGSAVVHAVLRSGFRDTAALSTQRRRRPERPKIMLRLANNDEKNSQNVAYDQNI